MFTAVVAIFFRLDFIAANTLVLNVSFEAKIYLAASTLFRKSAAPARTGNRGEATWIKRQAMIAQ